jgi:hypothetical protein
MSELEPSSQEQIRRYALGALNLAGVRGVIPVPLEQIESAVGLYPSEDLLAAGVDLPPGFLEKARRLTRKVLGGLALTDKVIYLDKSLPRDRLRFTHGHELGHQVLPWHEGAYFADDSSTLSPATLQLLEAEANRFSAELIFNYDEFTTMADSYKPSVDVPLGLNTTFGASAHAALRRYVETSGYQVALLVVGQYPTYPGGKLALKVFQRSQSAAFAHRYGQLATLLPASIVIDQHPTLKSLVNHMQGVGATTEMVLDTKRGLETFHVGSFNNGRLTFALIYRRPRVLGRTARIEGAA